MAEIENIELGLEEIRKRRRLVWFLLFCYLPTMIVLSLLLKDELIEYFVFGYLIIFGFIIIRSGRSRCPKCGDLFSGRIFRRANPWTQQCINCGLSLKKVAGGITSRSS